MDQDMLLLYFLFSSWEWGCGVEVWILLRECTLTCPQGKWSDLLVPHLLPLIASNSELDNGLSAVITKAQHGHDGSTCFCYHISHPSQNTALNLHRIPCSHRRLDDQYPHQSPMEIAGFFEAWLWGWICWANMVHTEPPWTSLFG